ncbi:MAG TPA: N-methyl-L-tryptophan oxidase [Pirellula sp.]|nr:N-methyl-L-tryptophan oxidase [Pirellula sp.]
MYDVIVLGLGGVGSATAYALAKQGHCVLGIDQFSPPHNRGSSHGETRIIRKSYFEHPSYVPLLCRAYDLWRELESRTSTRLYYATGLLEIGPADGIVIPGVLRSAAQFELPIERLTMAEATYRYPNLHGDDSWSVILEEDAGYLKVEACVQAHLESAAALGAELVFEQKVIGWEGDGSGVLVRTSDRVYRASKLILTAGPWAGELLRGFNIPLRVLHKHLYWYETNNHSYREVDGFPCFFYETPAGHFYGFPELDALGMKIARHSGGESVESSVDGVHQRNAEDQLAVESFLGANLPDVSRRMSKWSGCYYTMTPDENFIIDTLPQLPQVIIVAGLSGHGFKFTSVLGELAASLATQQLLLANLKFLQLSRFMEPTVRSLQQ